MKAVLEIWTVYDHPSDSDMPYVARLWHVDSDGTHWTDTTFTAGTLDLVRRWLEFHGLSPIPRDPDDDPVIIETWV